MKKIYLAFFLTGLICSGAKATIAYAFTALPGLYVPLAGATVINELYGGSDAVVSAPYAMGFSFSYDGTAYTDFQVSDNGCLFFGNSVPPGDPVSGDAILPNDLSIANSTRPFAAPLWDDHAVWGNASYLLTGTSPNRVLTVEWNQMDWKYNVAAFGGTHNNISFQVKLYETTNVIEFIYNPEAGTLAGCPGLGCASASIGLAGSAAGDYYSLNNSGAAPLASKSLNTTTISTKPAAGQTYRWTPGTGTGLQELSAGKGSSVFYDNQSGQLNINYEAAEPGNLSFVISDALGRRCGVYSFESRKGKNNFLIPFDDAAGVYVVEINGIMTRKFIR
jgi:hypothetical protein